MALSIKKLHKTILKRLSYNDTTGQLKIYHKNMFNYPKNHKSKKFKFESHNNIKIDTIISYVQEMLTSKSYKNCNIIHPYLFGIAWTDIKKNFKVKKCESSQCNEVVLREDYNTKLLNYKPHTRELLKITCLLLGNKLIETYFSEYYNYLLSDKGITIEEKIHVPYKWIDIKLSFNDKINICVKINDKHQDKIKEQQQAIEIFNKTNTMPILYYYDTEDMTNIMPKIYLEFCYAIAKTDIYQALKFYLIIIDKLEPFFVNFSINNINSKRINISDITDTLKEAGMTNISKYIKILIIEGLLGEDDIYYEDKDVLNGNVSQIGCDIIFMRLTNKFFPGLEKENIAAHLCKQYAIIKQKYFKTLKDLLSHQQKHFQIIFKNRNELDKKYHDIKPMKLIIQEMVEYLYINFNNNEFIQNIKKELNLELHPKYFFLVREEGKYMDGINFKKISKKKYHETEETSNNIINYRWIKQEEWEEIKNLQFL